MKTYPAKWMRLREVLATTLVGWLPTIALGVVLRRLLYPMIFKRMGTSVYIQNGAEFIGADHIEIGSGSYIFSEIRLNANNHNCRICIGDKVALERGVFILADEDCWIEIGESTYIGPYTFISGPGHVKIGKDCLIAAHTGIVANNHKFADPVEKIRNQGVKKKGIVIEDDCWLGYGVTVLDGVKIGQGSVIGAGAVVTKDLPPYSVAVGVPARVISSRHPSASTQDQESLAAKDDSRLTTPFSAALSEIEQTLGLSYQHMQILKETVCHQLLLEKLLYVLLDGIRQIMAVDTIAVLIKTEDREKLAVYATIGLEEEIAEKIRIPLGRGFAGQIAAKCDRLIVEDLSTVEVVSPILRNKGIKSMVGVPLLVKEQAIGVFHVGTFRSRHFTEEDAQLLQLVADRIGYHFFGNKLSTV